MLYPTSSSVDYLTLHLRVQLRATHRGSVSPAIGSQKARVIVCSSKMLASCDAFEVPRLTASTTTAVIWRWRFDRSICGPYIILQSISTSNTDLYTCKKKRGKRHNRVHPGHFATQQGTPFYPAGMSAADWSTLVFTLLRRKIAWVHPTKATFFQNCALILDKYPVVSENETLPSAISPAEIILRSRQRAPKYTSSRAKHTVRNRHQGPASSSSA